MGRLASKPTSMAEASPITAPPQMHWQHLPGLRDGQECSPDAGLAGEWQQPQQWDLSPARTLPAPKLQHSGQLKIVAISKMEIVRLNMGGFGRPWQPSYIL